MKNADNRDFRFATIRGTAAELGVPSDRIRAWVKQGKVKGFYSGSRFYVNVAQLQEALERGDFATPAPTQTEREEAR